MRTKHKSTKSLRKKLWKLISEYVRRSAADDSGYVRCYTCGCRLHWKSAHCGHYIHRDVLDYEINNLRPQCPRCNKWLHGNLSVYAEKLIAEIGAEEIQLMRQRSKKVKKWSIVELEDMIETYTKAVGDLTKGV